MENSMQCNLVWFRRDLRIEDNPAFIAAANCPGFVLPVFIWCPAEEGEFQPGRHSRWWLKQSLIHLEASLVSLGTSLVVQKGTDSLSVLVRIAQANGSTRIFWNHLYDPISVTRDRRLKKKLLEYGIVVHTFNSDTLYEPWDIYDEHGRAFTTFSTFWNRCSHLKPELPASPQCQLLLHSGESGKVPAPCTIEELYLEDEYDKSSNELLAQSWSPGWMNANKALRAFIDCGLNEYPIAKETVTSSTSRLSPYLHFGELSVRKLYSCIRSKQRHEEHRRSTSLFLRAVGFREYSRYISFHFPFTQEQPPLKNFPWRSDELHFKAWKQGRTGYPLVDAAMRELWTTGWLHCKLRVVTSSFLTKILQLPWTWGLRYFWDTLLDADLESDLLGWKYVSGCLADGHEAHFILDPYEEGCKLDSDGAYVRRWLPEISRLPKEWIHRPYCTPVSKLQAAGVELGTNYPKPIVDMNVAKYRLQQALKDMREQDAADQAAKAEEGQGETIPMIHSRHKSADNICDQLVPSVQSGTSATFLESEIAKKRTKANLP